MNHHEISCQTHTQTGRKRLRGQSKGSQNSSYTLVLLNGFFGVHWRLLNLYKHCADNRSNICSSKAVMTQHSQAADRDNTRRDVTLHVPMTTNLSAHTQYISACPWEFQRKKISQNFCHHPHSSLLLFPSSLSSFSSVCPLTPLSRRHKVVRP